MPRIATTALLCLALAAPAGARSLVEQRVIEANPCARLRQDTAFGTIAIDRIRDVRVNTAIAALQGDTVTASLDIWLACGSGKDALLAADVSARVRLEGHADLATCKARDVSARLSDFGGSAGPLLQSLAPQVEDSLRSDIAREASRLCREFGGGVP